jgi:hypothetical protein
MNISYEIIDPKYSWENAKKYGFCDCQICQYLPYYLKERKGSLHYDIWYEMFVKNGYSNS